MRRLVLACVVGVASLAPLSAQAESPTAAPVAAKARAARGRFVLFLAPHTVNGRAIKPKHPLLFPAAVFVRGNAIAIGGKSAPHASGVIAGNALTARDARGLQLSGKIASNGKVSAASGTFSLAAGKVQMTGTFALVPFSTAGGELMGGGMLTGKGLAGWTNVGQNSPSLGAGMGTDWGYTGPGLFSGPEKANLSGTPLSGANGQGAWDTFWNWLTGSSSSSSSSGGSGGSNNNGQSGDTFGDNFAQGASAIDKMNQGQYYGTGSANADDATNQIMAGKDDPSNSPDERQTYGTGGFNPNQVLKGQDGPGTGLDGVTIAGPGTGFRGGPDKGDNPFELTSADKLNVNKLINGAADPGMGPR